MTWRILDPAGQEIPYASLSVSRSLEQLSSSARWKTHTPRRDLLNQRVQVLDGDVVRFTGFVEQIEGDSLNGYEVGARSLTSSLLLYDADGSEVFKGASVLAVLRSMCQRVSLDVAPGAPTDEVRRLRLKRSEELARGVQRLAETYRFVATDDGQGRLVAYRSSETRAATWRDRQGTVTGAIVSRLDVSQWRNEWLCRGQREIVSDDGDDAAQIGLEVETLSDRPTRRVLPNKSATSRAHARLYVTWVAQAAFAGVDTLTVPHDRWPADPGDRVRVVVPTEAIDDDYIVQAVAVTVAAGQVSASATCVLPDVYQPAPRPPRSVEQRGASRERKLADELLAKQGATR